ncbi:MAG: sensor histidine kinase [Caldilineaceae bacterium]|nr:sensor histidine kinase [Caldilineaceae bacterium]
MKRPPAWLLPFLRIPLFYKILIANLAVVAVGAVLGTMITVWHVVHYPNDPHVELIVLFAGAGLLISFAVNSWVLRRALAPLDRLQQAVDDVRAGAANVVVETGPAGDERFDRLAETFNQMVAQLEQNARRMQYLSHQILQAQEEERHRLARELHDEAAQALTSLLLRLRLLERSQDPAEAQKRVQELRALTGQALEEVRRVALDLRPTILDDLGLAPALEWRVDEFNQAGTVRATLDSRGLGRRLPRDVELIFYRIGQEALSNVARHARATAATLVLEQHNGCLELRVTDNGQGFDPGSIRGSGQDGAGLLGMRERLAMIQGTLEIVSSPGQGTTLIARAPVVLADAVSQAPVSLTATSSIGESV